jgi:hypothetical protein
MADCAFSISGLQKLKKGDTVIYELSPSPDGALCSVQWSINGRPMKAGDTIADLYIRQVGFDQVTVTAEVDDPGAKIVARVTCRGKKECGPTDIRIDVGTPPPEDSMKAGNIVLLVLLPFIIIVGVALLPVVVIVFIIDKVSETDESKHVKKVRAELRALLPSWFR